MSIYLFILVHSKSDCQSIYSQLINSFVFFYTSYFYFVVTGV